MKNGWERQHELVLLTEDDLLRIIKSFNSSLRVKSYVLLSGGLSHTNYKVIPESDDQPFVVRISRDRMNLVKEYNLHKLLKENKMIPEFYHFGEYEGVFWGVLEWKEGELLSNRFSEYSPLETYKAGYTLGHQLGSLRQFQFEKPGFLNSDLNVTESFELTPEGFLNTMEYFLFKSKSPLWLENGLPNELMKFCTGHSELFLEDNSGPRIVHGDFNGLNLLMDNTKVSAILDWEFAIAGSMYLDIGNLLRYKDFAHFQEFEFGLQSGLTESGEQLPEKWKMIAKLADLIALCSMLDNDFGGTNRVRDINYLIRASLNNE